MLLAIAIVNAVKGMYLKTEMPPGKEVAVKRDVDGYLEYQIISRWVGREDSGLGPTKVSKFSCYFV